MTIDEQAKELRDLESKIRLLCGCVFPALRILGKTRCGPLGVSTVETSDLGCLETAVVVLATGKAYPVQRYETDEEALAGHAAWVAQVERGQRVFPFLGYEDLIPDGTIDLTQETERT